MKLCFAFSPRAVASLGRWFGTAFLSLMFLVATMTHVSAAATSTPAATPAPGTNQVSAPVSSEIPQSLFVVPSNPKEGRNPFFPNSTFGMPVPPPPQAPTTVDRTLFVLNGITSPPKRTAMINGRTFEVGEEGEVRLPSGAKELIKCEEIGADFTVISARGQRIMLKFRSSP